MTHVSQPGPSRSTMQNDSPSLLSWEGDKMFNIYIYDYCFKRGFRKTAQELLLEADIPPDSQPPINARQGLLFEYAILDFSDPRPPSTDVTRLL
ncbi:hypothetical protein GYMLUDRAFT_173362 [Collybiopsis luxurians FD-317 M1]|uniref:LisH domain-containing protein n=1 Tax=Collybiopsis luxurians FD-317 M1 TaxID=944289 RepID=A0A0D0CG04_9AGAR|nr:hypothetical protein GYMLUDRAFT_173362 [Collybiopsis luxurians FD-317 M1]